MHMATQAHTDTHTFSPKIAVKYAMFIILVILNQ
jgi:hypothetical protein